MVNSFKMAEEAGVEPTEDAWRPPTGLKPARVTGPDSLPLSILQNLSMRSKVACGGRQVIPGTPVDSLVGLDDVAIGPPRPEHSHGVGDPARMADASRIHAGGNQ